MKKVTAIIIVCAIFSLSLADDDKSKSASNKNDPFSLEMEKLKTEFQLMEKEIAAYYDEQRRVLKLQQKEEVGELKDRYKLRMEELKSRYEQTKTQSTIIKNDNRRKDVKKGSASENARSAKKPTRDKKQIDSEKKKRKKPTPK